MHLTTTCCYYCFFLTLSVCVLSKQTNKQCLIYKLGWHLILNWNALIRMEVLNSHRFFCDSRLGRQLHWKVFCRSLFQDDTQLSIYKSCSWLTKLAFHLQTVHLILQTCISLTIVAIHFSNVASRFTIKRKNFFIFKPKWLLRLFSFLLYHKMQKRRGKTILS